MISRARLFRGNSGQVEVLVAFLTVLNPDADRVGLAVLPPATSTSNRSTTPQTANYDSTAAYTIVPLSHGYRSPPTSSEARPA